MAEMARHVDVLLICPNYYSKVLVTDAIVPPTNLAALAAYLRERSFSVGIIDGRVLNYRLDDYREAVTAIKPKIVGITVMTSYVNQAVEIATMVKTISPETVVVVGGAHISALPEDSLRDYLWFDIAVFGEGEITIHELAESILRNGRDFSQIDGICYRENGRIQSTRPRALIQDLDSLPLPAYDLLPMDKYRPAINWIKKLPSMMIYTARGCPYNCTFCASHCNFGRTVRFRSPEKIVEEIELYKRQYGIKQVVFYDDTLIINKKQIHALCDLLRERKLNIWWGCFSTIEAIQPDLAKKMKEAGCFMIFFGLESGSEEMLKRMNKTYKFPELAKKVVRWVHEAGITPIGSFMFGHPGDSEKIIEETIQFALSMPLRYATFVTVVPFPGSPIFDYAKEKGLLPDRITDWSGFEEFRDPFVISDVPRERLQYYMKRAYRKFYFRLSVMCRILLDSLSFYKLWHNVKTSIRIMRYAFRRGEQ